MTFKEGVPLVDYAGESPSTAFPDEAGWDALFNERPAVKKRAWARWKSWAEWKKAKNWTDLKKWFPFVEDLSTSVKVKIWIKFVLLLVVATISSLIIYSMISWIANGLVYLFSGHSSGSTGSMPSIGSIMDRTLILISLDGFRAEYLRRGLTPTLERLAKGGIQADHLIPCFPSVTFPNHYSIVTGLYPGSHGVVGNTYFDSRLNETFSYNNATQNAESKWWEGGEPLWVTAEKQGKKSASLMWPGSEAAIQGMRPSLWKPYSSKLSPNDRVDQALEWLDLPIESRPAFMSLYFPNVDGVGHEKGVHSPELDAVLRLVDSALERLVDGLESRSILGKVNLVIVSDHGMSDTSPSHVIYLDDYIDLTKVKIVENGPLLMLYPQGPHVNETASIYTKLQNAAAHSFTFQTWLKESLPVEFHYVHADRVGPIVLQAEIGYTFTTHIDYDGSGLPPWPKGMHGYPSDEEDMDAIFIGHGSAFIGPKSKQKTLFPAFENVQLYQLMASILGIKVDQKDGSPAWFRSLHESQALADWVS